jgi:hypothetical protein
VTGVLNAWPLSPAGIASSASSAFAGANPLAAGSALVGTALSLKLVALDRFGAAPRTDTNISVDVTLPDGRTLETLVGFSLSPGLGEPFPSMSVAMETLDEDSEIVIGYLYGSISDPALSVVVQGNTSEPDGPVDQATFEFVFLAEGAWRVLFVLDGTPMPHGNFSLELLSRA